MSTLHDIVAAAVASHAPQAAPDAAIAVAVIKNGEIIFAEGFGLCDLVSRKPVDAQTVFAIGSTTKAFTSFVALRIAQDGVVDLDVPVRTYLPDFAIADETASAQATLTDMMSHQCGVPRHDALWYLGPFDRGQLYYRARHLGPCLGSGTGFREKFQYNNIIYSLVGTALEAASGRSWSDLVRTLIMDPLALSATFSIAELRAAPNHAAPYAGAVALAYDDIENIAPAGAINANVLDMARWLLLLLDKGRGPSGAKLIAPEQLESMYRSRIAAQDGGYGLGWYVGQMQGKRLLHHPGNAQGYTAYTSLMPDDGLAIVALTNQNVSAFPGAVADATYAALLNDPSIETHKPGATLLDLHHSGPLAAPLAGAIARSSNEFHGLYCNAGYGDISVTNTGGQLHLSYYDMAWPLLNVAGDQFCFDLHAFGAHLRPPVIFSRDASGAVDAARIPFEPTAAPVRFERRTGAGP